MLGCPTPADAEHTIASARPSIARRRCVVKEEDTMSEQTSENRTDMDRREFLTTTAAVGGAMVLGFWMPPSAQAANLTVAPTPWYRRATGPEIKDWNTIAAHQHGTSSVAPT